MKGNPDGRCRCRISTIFNLVKQSNREHSHTVDVTKLLMKQYEHLAGGRLSLLCTEMFTLNLTKTTQKVNEMKGSQGEK